MHCIIVTRHLLSLSIVCFLLIHFATASLFDYFPLGKSLFGSVSTENDISSEFSMQKIPYEVEVTDEKFIEQAAKFSGVSLSELDKCQHRVILKLQEECHKLNDEQLAKLAVKLLNCQSAIEGRHTYPCTNQMSIRDCTSSMDPDTWNSYLLMSNRARAVCYSIRQAQFRGLTELTVNKLMGAAHEQLNIMSRLSDGQFRIEQATSATIETVIQGNEALRIQQHDIRQAQFYGQLAIEDNIRRLRDEKQLIIDGHAQLAEMTKDVQMKLDEAAKQIDYQSEERKDNHKEILNDLIEIQQQAQAIFLRIEDSSRHMLEQSALTAQQYEATLSQLAQVNSTVYALVDVVSSTRSALEEKLKWISKALGGTDDAVERLYLFISHTSYLLLAMVSCAFLHVAVPCRIALIVLVPINLIVSLQQGAANALDFVNMTAALLTFITVQITFSYTLSFWRNYPSKQEAIQYKETQLESNEVLSVKEENQKYDSSYVSNSSTVNNDSFSYRNGSLYQHYELDSTDNFDMDEDAHFVSPTPPLSRPSASRSRSKTPQHFNRMTKRQCLAKTRLGACCKSPATSGRDFCFRHITGSSVVQ